MKFENEFEIDAPVDQVWDTVLDVERVAPTVPGAKVLEQTGDNAYKVAIKVKVGPMSMTYTGNVEITERDEEAHRAVMKARAKESRGQGTADADVTMVLSGDDGRTSATVTTDVELSGKVATMGQGVLQDVSGRLVKTFAANLAAMLEGGEDPRYIARRMIVLASEDVGNADPQALPVAVAASQAVEHVGLPECALNLAQAAVYLSLAPKSNASYKGLSRARAWIREHGTPEIPAHLRDAHYHGAAKLGRGQGYDYPHDRPEGLSPQSLMPDEAAGETFLKLTEHGEERELRERLERVRRARSG